MTEFVGYGPEVDKAWRHITYDVGDQMITPSELDRLGLDPNSLTVKDPKTGKEGYRVGIQVFHQLHCLNLLRQETYSEYYSHTGGDVDVPKEDLRGHLGKSSLPGVSIDSLQLTKSRSLPRDSADQLDVPE